MPVKSGQIMADMNTTSLSINSHDLKLTISNNRIL